MGSKMTDQEILKRISEGKSYPIGSLSDRIQTLKNRGLVELKTVLLLGKFQDWALTEKGKKFINNITE